MAKFEETKQGKKFASPIKAIRTFCGKCICGGIHKIEACETTDCDLFAYRTGKNPFSKRREMSEEQREAASERFKKMWADGRGMGRGAKKAVPAKAKKVVKKPVAKKVVKANKK